MKYQVVSTIGLAAALEAEGFPLPKECRRASLVMDADSALVIQYEVLVTDDDLGRLGRALVRISEDKG